MQGCQEQFLMLGSASMQVVDGSCGSGPHKGAQPGEDFLHISTWRLLEQVPIGFVRLLYAWNGIHIQALF